MIWHDFFSGLTELNEIKLKTQHTLVLRQEKEGTGEINQ